MDTLLQFLGLILHIDKSLGVFIQNYGAWVYAVLFLIVFCETGLVVFPFLPGDSLLFIGGAFAASHEMDLFALIALLLVAAIVGNTVNYWIGRAIGPKGLRHEHSRARTLSRPGGAAKDAQLLRETRRQDYRDRAFRAGGADLRAVRRGVSSMSHARFQLFNILGALIWVLLLVLLGYFFGNIPFIKQYLNVIVLVGIGAAIVPIAIGALWKMSRRNSKA